ncbi:YesK family protein [Bacillus pumilus]|nr:YesK family protein [Bacillus pumilus]
MFWLQTAVFTIVLLCLSWWSGKKHSHPHASLIVPIWIILLGLGLLMISFFVGKWEGITLAISSVSLILSSIVCFIIITAFRSFKEDDSP